MDVELVVKNIVLAGSFNVTSFDKYFFIKNNIVKEEEILQGSIFDTLLHTQVVGNKFHLLINPTQTIISSNIFSIDSKEDRICEILISIINAYTSMNINAIGINFHWQLKDESKSLAQLSKDYFFNDKLELFSKFFNSDDSMYGVYASVNFKNARLKLDIKPNLIQSIDNQINKEAITFNFNFHIELKKKNDPNELIKYLKDYNSYAKESYKILSIYK